MFDLLDEACEGAVDPHVQAWLDYETSQFIDCELSEAADCHHQWLTDVCGSDDLLDVRAEMRAWWNEEVRLFRSELLRERRNEGMAARSGAWHEDFELESRRHLAFLGGSMESLC